MSAWWGVNVSNATANVGEMTLTGTFAISNNPVETRVVVGRTQSEVWLACRAEDDAGLKRLLQTRGHFTFPDSTVRVERPRTEE